MKASHTAGSVSVRFDDKKAVSVAGLLPVMRLADRAGLHELAAGVQLGPSPRRWAAGANPDAKISSIVAGMATGADSIDDLAILRHGGLSGLFDGIRAPSTLGTFVRYFTPGHVAQLEGVSARFTQNLAALTPLLPGVGEFATLDVDSSISEVYGTTKEGAAWGHTKKLGLNILASTLCTPTSAPVILATRLRGGNADTRRKARSHVRAAIRRARALGATGMLVVRLDCGYYVAAILHAITQAGAYFSVTAPQRPDVIKAEEAIDAQHWQPLTTRTGIVVEGVEIAETTITVFNNPTTQRGMRTTARLIVRRSPAPPERREIDGQIRLFPKHHYHAVLTNLPTQPEHDQPGPARTFDTLTASYHHAARAGAIETVFADLYAGPLAHMPSGRFHANAAWLTLAALTHNLLRALGTLAGPYYATARIATIRRHLITIAARTTTTARHTTLRAPDDWPWATAFQTIFTATHRPTTT